MLEVLVARLVELDVSELDATVASLKADERTLELAEELLGQGAAEAAAAVTTHLAPAAVAVVHGMVARLSLDSEAAAAAFDAAAAALRQPDARDPALEARVRMELGLVAVERGEFETAREHLDWAEQRAKALAQGSALHGRTVLNKGAFHEVVGEPLMALHVYSEVSRHGDHLPDTLGLARLRAGRLLASEGRLHGALRNLWLAAEVLQGCRLDGPELEARLGWLQLGLPHADPAALSMSAAITLPSVERDHQRADDARVAPSDVQQALDRSSALAATIGDPLADEVLAELQQSWDAHPHVSRR